MQLKYIHQIVQTPFKYLIQPSLGKTGQMMSNLLDNKLREDLERLKKIRAHR